MSNTRLFTSECVADGHPDKVCDQISDAILDEALRQDPLSRVAMEAAVKGDTVMVFGEMTTNAEIDISQVVRNTLVKIGYSDPQWGFDPWKIKQIHNISEQSREIGDSVTADGERLGAGDQGMMFGYAVEETPEMMPLPLMAARDIIEYHKHRRTQLNCPWGPDAKSQVTVRYADNGEPIEFDTVVLSTVHLPGASMASWRDDVLVNGLARFEHLITPNTKVFINPAGPWTVGGPIADSGLTGRKIIVDTYGGAARHGGGAFSGKDPTKVDRSAAYAARHLAKLLCHHLGRYRTEVQLSYAIGVAEPVSVHVYGMHEDEIKETLKVFDIDLTPAGIIDRFDLRRPIYQVTAAKGHFGHDTFPWEQVE